MAFTRVLHVVALFLMQGDFPGAGGETVTLKEGEDLNLRCTLSGDGSSARQWLNPRGFGIFLNTQRALRDQRYKLTHYSKEELSIRLSNVTVHDEGVYRCFSYGIPFKSKNETVEVLAAPSNPVLDVSRHTERSITLSCYTHGCKPQPQVTWLLDNGIELPGDTTHELEADGKKWTTTSRLTVLAYGPGSTASCIVHHQALKEELMASFHFEDIPRTEQNVQPEGMETKENNLLLPILVAALIFALLIIVLLFMRKLKKAHGVWKRENDVSDQTVESYKSKSNEDSTGHEKNGHVVNQKSNMQYVTDGYAETMQKNPTDTNLAISEKLFGCGRETNV
ncbi:cytotoxic and regulatory T-cell molecule [Patagioenas fasciata monilis]|uniref:Cytotoxic and regulatory T-cell molecule n=1 Tax=Patagioenas fasciata monilis TaxID=372326 RepID=A0A1V4J7R3_PATFA|nr:cytotoxic and regulatory T-cell molecule [Patagioenas fasciata monilis]